MIKNIIFDFGDIFINLDKQVVYREIEKFGGDPLLINELYALNDLLEVGGMDSKDFIAQLVSLYPMANEQEITRIWNSILLDFPDYRLEFIEQLAMEKEYRLFLLSNTNGIHIPHVAEKMGLDNFNRFKNCFEQFYLSHEIRLRKPHTEIFEFVLQRNGLLAHETFFVDDTKENTDAAEKVGIRCWNLLVGKEDVVDLKSRLPHV